MTTLTRSQTLINDWPVRATRVVAVCLSLAILVVAVLGYRGVSARPYLARPHTYRAAIMMALDERAIIYRDIQVHDACQTNPSDCSGSWVAVTTATDPVSGQITCQRYHEDCTLSLTMLDIHHIPLPALAQDVPWLRAIKQRIQAFVLSFRTRLRL
jgi:hypothetical protein